MNTKPLRIALTKGRLEKDTVGLLEKIGFDCTAVREKGRKLTAAEKDKLIEELTRKMKDAAKRLEFEEAAYIRDRISELRKG